jgi:hypothetical protein
LDRGADEPGQQRSLLDEPIHRLGRVVLGVQAPAPEQPPEPIADSREHRCHVAVARSRRRVRLERVRGRVAEDPIERQRVKMRVGVQAAACALDHGDGARPPAVKAARAGAARVAVEQHAREHTEHRTAQAVVERHPVAQR